ncbi:hypothetical protein RSAG8_06698, partial [Rhizoctonia solani AG-8 WAC10335]
MMRVKNIRILRRRVRVEAKPVLKAR